MAGLFVSEIQMDVSKLANLNTVVPLSTKVGRAADVTEAAPRGNSLPAERQPVVALESQQDKSSNSPTNGEELQGLVDKANEALSMRFSNLKFTVADGTEIPVVRIEDSETGELIRQIPSEQMVALAKALDEIKQGNLLEEMA